ncbi:MAG: MBL fold metallo-hydrolase [Asgard group archaeon]|nr:MBL fold metallo-hydrolase [Asgard group archaeon]
MIVKKINDNGIAFTLNDPSNPDYYCPANIYVLIGDEYFFLNDGYFGSEILKDIVNSLEKEFGNKLYVLFNSHWHWDHLRGNTFFEDATILSHQLTKKTIVENNKDKSKVNAKYMKRKIVLPNLTFENEYSDYKDENIIFFHSPGHTEDSSTCYDLKNNVLFAGDNVEYPLPYVTSSDLSTYISTLKKYLEYPVEIVIPSHGYVTDKKLIESNLRYLESFPEIESNMYTNETKNSFLMGTIKNLSTVGDDYFTKNDLENAIIYYKKIVSINKKENILSEEELKIHKAKLNEIIEKLK